MGDAREKLVGCFELVFPQLDRGEIPGAAQVSLGAWDSVASATLFAAVEEAFEISLEPEDLEFFVSFELILDLLAQKTDET